MKPDFLRKKDVFILVIGAVILNWGLNYLGNFFSLLMVAFGIISPFLLGIGIAFLLNLPMRAIEKGLKFIGRKLKLRSKKLKKALRPLSICLTIAIVLLIVSGVVAIVVPKITATVSAIQKQCISFIAELQTIESSSETISIVIDWLEKLGLDFAELSSLITKGLNTAGNSVFNTSLSIVTTVFDKAVAMGIAVIFAIYILSGKERIGQSIKKLLQAYLSPKTVSKITDHVELIDDTFSTFFRGQCLEACILGSMFFIGMTIFRFPHALLISILVAITALIPVFGAFIACFIGAFLMLVQSPMMAVWFVVFFLVMQQIEGNFIYPHVMGSRIGLPSIWVLVAVTLGGTMFGVIGMLLFIPVFSIVYTLLKRKVNEKILKKEKAVSEDKEKALPAITEKND